MAYSFIRLNENENILLFWSLNKNVLFNFSANKSILFFESVNILFIQKWAWNMFKITISESLSADVTGQDRVL